MKIEPIAIVQSTLVVSKVANPAEYGSFAEVLSRAMATQDVAGAYSVGARASNPKVGRRSHADIAIRRTDLAHSDDVNSSPDSLAKEMRRDLGRLLEEKSVLLGKA